MESSLRDQLVLPQLRRPETWPSRPGVRLRIDLTDPPPECSNQGESAYAAGLTALRQGEVLAALENFRAVVTQDGTGLYSTARLLALLLSAEVGDVASLKALLEPCLTNAQPDLFAQRAIEDAALDVYDRAGEGTRAIRVGECLDQPAVTAQIALAACLLAVGQVKEAVSALEDGITVWEARHTAWTVERDRHIDQILCERLWNGTRDGDVTDFYRRAGLGDGLELRKFPTKLTEDWYYEEHRDELYAEVVRRAASPGSTAPRRAGGPLVGFDDTMCRLYGDLGDFDAIIRYVETYPPWEGSSVQRAVALSDKGMPDAALVALDDYLRKPESQTWANLARYQKAAILLEQGDRRRARRELARLYADDPQYPDRRGLRASVEAAAPRTSRAPIPEEVRHAVWRRDQGRCVTCGSQEKLEFDHIIPVSRGGANTERNLQLLCESCNRSKSATI
ncbi:MAG TPA: HNH endonuclease signature motif containing protein [Solirubrobacteraceae bacterium]|jgi:tetratricopeptide (TPR) repeat protein|nr:HNH endonuclease signature motif containing protein [Solirubrobacteraceae bacterium]